MKLSATRQELHGVHEEVGRIREKQEEMTDLLNDLRSDLKVHMALHAAVDKQEEKDHHTDTQWGTTKLLAVSCAVSTFASSVVTHFVGKLI